MIKTGPSVLSLWLSLVWPCAVTAAAYSAAPAVAKPAVPPRAPDYSKRAQNLNAALQTKLLGKWTNPVDHVIVEITSVDLTSGQLRGIEWAQTGPAAWDAHELIGWVSA